MAMPADAMTTAAAGPVVHDDVITFRLHDPDRAFQAVGLMQDLQRPRDWIAFSQDGEFWFLDFPRPDVDRMEYQLKGVHQDGGEEVFCDPGNPQQAPGAF